MSRLDNSKNSQNIKENVLHLYTKAAFSVKILSQYNVSILFYIGLQVLSIIRVKRFKLDPCHLLFISISLFVFCAAQPGIMPIPPI